MLTAWKKEENLDFLNDVSSVPLQQGLRHLQSTFANFFAGRAKYPNFKRKSSGGSAEFTKAAFRWKEGQIFLAKSTVALQVRWSRAVPEGCEPSPSRSSCPLRVDGLFQCWLRSIFSLCQNWECPSCGTNHDRDVNAASNILAAELAVSVCGATVRPEQSKSVKAGATKQKT